MSIWSYLKLYFFCMCLLHDLLFLFWCHHGCSLSGSSSRNHQNSIDWTLSSSDVIAPSPWTIFGCQNGKNLFHSLLFGLLLFFNSKIVFIGLHNQNLAKTCTNVFMGVMKVYDYSRKQKIGILVGRLAKFLFSKRFFIFNLKWKRLILEYPVHSLQKRDDHPAIMAVGVVDGTSEAIFQTLMALGPSRSE